MPSPPRYPVRDVRRLLMVLGAISELRNQATLVNLAARTNLDKHTVTRLVDQARRQLGVDIEKDGPRYRIASWGLVIRSTGAMAALNPLVRTKRR